MSQLPTQLQYVLACCAGLNHTWSTDCSLSNTPYDPPELRLPLSFVMNVTYRHGTTAHSLSFFCEIFSPIMYTEVQKLS